MGNGMVDHIVKVSSQAKPLLVHSCVLDESINSQLFGSTAVQVVNDYRLEWDKVDAMVADGASYVKKGFNEVSHLSASHARRVS